MKFPDFLFRIPFFRPDTDWHNIAIVFITLPLFFFSLSGIFWPVFIILGLHALYKIRLAHLKQESVLITIFVIFAALKLLQSPTVYTVLMFRSSIGLFFFYFYFSYINKIKINTVLLWTAVLTIFIEFALRMPSNKTEVDIYNFLTINGLTQGNYSRVSGFGGNSSITSSVLVLYLFSLGESLTLKLKSAIALCILMCGSGVGFLGLILFTIHSIYKLKKMKIILGLITISAIITAYTYYYFYQDTLYHGSPFYKLSPKYFSSLLSSKVEEIRVAMMNTDLFSMLFGLSSEQCLEMNKCIGGDFGWKSAFQLSGIFGVLTYVYMLWRILPNTGTKLFSYLSIFHYSILLFPGAQIFLGYLSRKQLPHSSQIDFCVKKTPSDSPANS
jgi:hypothetical protein